MGFINGLHILNIKEKRSAGSVPTRCIFACLNILDFFSHFLQQIKSMLPVAQFKEAPEFSLFLRCCSLFILWANEVHWVTDA